MKSLLSVATVLLLATTTAQGESLSVLWGVQTAHEATYTAAKTNGKFSCFDGSKTDLDIKYVNDQFCDCADGSDEPGTSACSYQVNDPEKWRFQCHAAIGGIYKELYHSRVNDGVCDCCDGSDEYDENTVCANNCAEAAQKEEKEAAEREARRQAGLAAKKELEASGEAAKAQVEKDLAIAQAELVSKETLLAPLREAKEAEEVLEGHERAAIHDKSLKEKATWEEEQAKIKEAEELAKQEEEAAAPAAATPDAGAPGEEETPATEEDDLSRYVCSKWRQTQACKGDGERDESHDKDCQTLIQGGWSGYCECFDAQEGVEVKHPFDCNHQPLTCDYVCSRNGKTAEKAPDAAEPPAPDAPAAPQFTVDDGSGHSRPEAVAAREASQSAQNAKDDAERRINDLKATTEAAYFAYPALMALRDVCLSKDAGSYSYHLCFFKEIHQGSRGQTHAGGTLMGRFESFGEQTYAAWGAQHDLTKMKYGHGQHCYSGPDRSVDVSVICGATNELLSVDEPSMCTYKMVLQTPAICE